MVQRKYLWRICVFWTVVGIVCATALVFIVSFVVNAMQIANDKGAKTAEYVMAEPAGPTIGLVGTTTEKTTSQTAAARNKKEKQERKWETVLFLLQFILLMLCLALAYILLKATVEVMWCRFDHERKKMPFERRCLNAANKLRTHHDNLAVFMLLSSIVATVMWMDQPHVGQPPLLRAFIDIPSAILTETTQRSLWHYWDLFMYGKDVAHTIAQPTPAETTSWFWSGAAVITWILTFIMFLDAIFDAIEAAWKRLEEKREKARSVPPAVALPGEPQAGAKAVTATAIPQEVSLRRLIPTELFAEFVGDIGWSLIKGVGKKFKGAMEG